MASVSEEFQRGTVNNLSLLQDIWWFSWKTHKREAGITWKLIHSRVWWARMASQVVCPHELVKLPHKMMGEYHGQVENGWGETKGGKKDSEREGKGRGRGREAEAFYDSALRVTQHHCCHILLLKAVTKIHPSSRWGNTNPPLERLMSTSHCKKSIWFGRYTVFCHV